MELKHIKELMAAMGRTGTKKLVLKKEDFELEIERDEYGGYRHVDSPLDLVETSSQRVDATLRRVNATLPKGGEIPTGNTQEVKKEDENALYVTSPMVGTFYSSPSPDEPSFVKPGDKIDKNTVVCIIEAMKVMNEVKAGVAGTVIDVLVENGHPVEFGTKLFRISS